VKRGRELKGDFGKSGALLCGKYNSKPPIESNSVHEVNIIWFHLISHDLILNDTLRAQPPKCASESGKSKRQYLRHATLVSGSKKVGSKKSAPARTPYMAHAVQAKDSLSGTPLLSLSPHFPQSTLKLVFSSQIHNGSSQGTAIELSGELIACVAR
jgi:hypothetical protein